MRALGSPPETLLNPIIRVVHAALTHADQLRPDDVMVVGAWCRDAWHHALGHTFATAMTHDLDLALALSSWDAYAALTDAFPRVGDTGIRFRVADVIVDLIPFGDIEHPEGTALPPTRDTGLSVWAFEEIFQAALALDLPDVGVVRIPTVPGFAAAKLGAWLDRSAWLEVKDAADLGLVLHWCAQPPAAQLARPFA
jgi:predicted nucleotidyltransferase